VKKKAIAFFRPPYSQTRGSSPCAMVAIQTKKYSNLALDINVFQHTRPCLGSVSLKWSLLHRLAPYAEESLFTHLNASMIEVEAGGSQGGGGMRDEYSVGTPPTRHVRGVGTPSALACTKPGLRRHGTSRSRPCSCW
jgi:hypothetical protein